MSLLRGSTNRGVVLGTAQAPWQSLHRMSLSSLLLIAIAIGLASGASARTPQKLPPPWLPLDPGEAHCALTDGGAQLSNSALRFGVHAKGSSLVPEGLENRFAHTTQALDGELFAVTARDGKRTSASQFKLVRNVSCTSLSATDSASRAAERHKGVALTGEFYDSANDLKVLWRASLLDGTNYMREQVDLSTARGADLASITLIDLNLPGAYVAGTVQGSPLIAADNFYGLEHPMSEARVEAGHATAFLKRVLPLRAGVAESYSAVLGAAPPGQLRRGFQAYLESERAAPFRTFLHYNSWYDIGYFTPYTQDDAVSVVNAFGQKLVRDRGVVMDSFLFDDGWDDLDHLWRFSADFPNGFTPVRAATEKYGAEPGVWLSPWGGYGQRRKQRLVAARTGGYEVDDQGLALSGRKYYPLFHDAALTLLKTYGINQFKFDGTGSPDKVTPGSQFDSDFAAAISLIGDLRAMKPELFVNLTTGTWPSPFWLRTADSIWRGGEDHSFAGVGSDRQRWITYRDSDAYGGIVRQGPLFPLNSLMLHGLIFARKAHGLNVDPENDFAAEVHSYFGSGTGLQEMYISPDLLSEQNWDTLAAAAKWARQNAAVLRDSHWIGGDPARLEVYGWAAWSPGHAIVTLRNPSNHPQTYALELVKALELPAQEPSKWSAAPAFGGRKAQAMSTGAPVNVELAPFEVVVWDLTPAGPSR